MECLDATLEDSVSVLIPARDEEDNIAACLDAVLAQTGVAEVVVYDDHSTDATGRVVAGYPGVRLIPAEPLPAGWCGKNFACSQLAAHAKSEWMLFLDADARLAPGAIAGMLASAQSRSLTFLSCWPGFIMVSFWEKLLMPLLNFVVFTIYPAPLSLLRRDPSLGLAHGACILVAKAAYERVGGHAAVASEIFEDTRLARLWRIRGEHSLCLDGQNVVRVRMYRTFSEIWSGFEKNLRAAFQSPFTFWLFLLAHALLFVLPFILFNRAALVVLAARLLLAIRFRHSLWSVLLHPFAECIMLALGISSWWKWRGGGVIWKGRRYQRT